MSRNDRDRLHLLATQLETELALLRGFAFCAAIIDVLIERMRGKARYYVVEPLPASGEIDACEGGVALIEKALRALQRIEYGILSVSHNVSSKSVHGHGE